MTTSFGVETRVDREFRDICRLLEVEAVDVLRRATNAATADATSFAFDMDTSIAGITIHDTVRVEVGPLHRSGAHTAEIPLTWHTARHHVLLPDGHGKLHLTAWSTKFHPSTDLVLTLEVRPALGPIGYLDELLEGRRRFLNTAPLQLGAIKREIERQIQPQER